MPRTDNRDPARDVFGKPGISYPTPEIEDVVIVERFTLKGKYEALSYGAPHPDNKAAKLVSQRRSIGDNNDVVVTRIYATERKNQSAYNAAISYTAQSKAHRVYSRSSLVLREGYAALDELSPDSANASALLTQEQASPAESPFDTLYLRVTRVYESFGTREEQDAWNRQDSFPYLLATSPRLTRVYRFPANVDPGFQIGTTLDLETGAALITLARQDESARVRVYTCVFDPLPSMDEQTGLGVSISYPNGTRLDPRVPWRFRIAKADYVPAEDYEACPIPGFSDLVLTEQAAVPAEDAASVFEVTRSYRLLPGPVLYSTDNTKLPRQLTPVPGVFLNDVPLTTITQDVYPGTATDTLGSTIVLPAGLGSVSVVVLSATVTDQTRLVAQRVAICRPAASLPTITARKFSREADGAIATQTQQVLDNTDGLPPALAGAFGLLSAEDTPLSPTQTERTKLSVTAYPTLSGAVQSSFGTSYPGKYKLEGETVTILFDQKVAAGTNPSGAAWTAALAVSGRLIERKNIDAYTDQVTVKALTESGHNPLSGQVVTPWGTAARVHTLGGSVEEGLGVLESETQPAGNGMMEAVTTRVNDPSPLGGAEYKVDVPERLLAGLELVSARSLVDAGTAPDSGASVISSSVKGKDQSNSEKETLSLPGGAEIANLSPVIDREKSAAARGAVAQTETKIVASDDDDPAIDFKTLDYRRRAIGDGNSEQVLVTVDDFPPLDDYYFVDRKLGVKCRETQTVVDATTAGAAAVSAGVETEYKAIDKWASIQIVKTFAFPESIPNRYGRMAAHRPSLMVGAPANLGVAASGKPKFQLSIQYGWNYVGATKTVTTIGTGFAEGSTDSLPRGFEIRYDGELWNLHLVDILLPAAGLTIDWGSEDLIVTATSPTVEEYILAVGSWYLVHTSVDPYPFGGKQIKEEVYLKLQ